MEDRIEMARRCAQALKARGCTIVKLVIENAQPEIIVDRAPMNGPAMVESTVSDGRVIRKRLVTWYKGCLVEAPARGTAARRVA